MKKTYFVSCQFLGSNGLLRSESFFLDEVEAVVDHHGVQCLVKLSRSYLCNTEPGLSLFETAHLADSFELKFFYVVTTKEYEIPWDKIMSLECPEIYKKIFQRLREVNNKPTLVGELIGGRFSRIQQTNQVLKLAGVPCSIKAIEGRKGETWSKHYRLTPR